MNRRNFIGTLLAATAGFTILPSAEKIWKARKTMWIPNPEWINAPYEVIWWMIEDYEGAIAYPCLKLTPTVNLMNLKELPQIKHLPKARLMSEAQETRCDFKGNEIPTHILHT